MWKVTYGRHWKHLTYKEFQFETSRWYLAYPVYLWWHIRYSMSLYPVKYVKMYKAKENVLSFKSYRISYKERKKRNT